MLTDDVECVLSGSMQTHPTQCGFELNQPLTLKGLRYGSQFLHRTCLYLISVHQMAPLQTEMADI